MRLWGSFRALCASLRGRLILSFLAVVILGIAISAWVGIRLIGDTVLAQAQSKVQHDLAAAWMVYNAKLEEIKAVVELTAERFFIREPFRTGELGPAQQELERVRREWGLDFLTLTDRAGVVLIRAREPYSTGDDRSGDEPVRRALAGETVAGTVLIPQEGLLLEGTGLAEQAHIEPIPTPKAKPQIETEVATSGMALLAAAPVRDEAGRVLGALYGGVLLNWNYELVDRIKETVYKGEHYLGKEVGTATIFQWDLRISTNVRTAAGERAIGTRVSAEVYDRVLTEGLPWTDRAFVVNDWYVTAYEPIRDLTGKIIGMLYVGMLEAPFTKLRAGVVWAIARYSSLSLVLALGLAFLLGQRITRPVAELARASEAISLGQLSQRVQSRSKDELGRLAASFNRMAESLQETIAEKDAANQRLQDLNLRYLELLGFATHELMQPLGVLKGYLTLMQASETGALEADRQRQAVAAMLRNLDSLINMSRMYLELSRIESGELEVHKERVRVYQDVLVPVIEDARIELERRGMKLTLEDERAFSALELEADPILLRAVFSNLIGNAIKYGREGGEIRCGFKDEGDSYRFHVWNEGPGIPADKLGAIFEKFVRLEHEASPRTQRGTGLGLFITKEIIARHGGEIRAESVEGEWADFIFRLPKEGKLKEE